ncbi:hypothetical protein EWM64_g5560 [Hericium alpestre]|uniref:Uncharacterized protein n=1 Tax=Hericium alpestre TaxID=135208 RepID=A0A4Y9ZWM8_9AGAM|nr:hypothetical protein EWM64_g5560 [Hericium alpestre]
MPLNIAEATYLLPPPEATLSSTDLIASHALALQKRQKDLQRLHSCIYEAHLQAACKFELEHECMIRDYDFHHGELVLVRNSVYSTSHSWKTKPCYLGPYLVLSRNKGRAYLLCELDSTLFDHPTAAYRIVPYFAHTILDHPPLEDFLDVSIKQFERLLTSTVTDPDDKTAGSNLSDFDKSCSSLPTASSAHSTSKED